MKKKGFTLIELLAVIVILAIIALIAVPIVLNIINNAAKSAFRNTAYGIIKAGELYYADKQLDLTGITEDIVFTFPEAEGLEFKGKRPSSGTMTINTDGEISLSISDGKYCARKSFSQSEITVTDGVCVAFKTYQIGEEVTFDPGDGENTTWYVVDDNEMELTLILNKNLGDPIEWISEEDYKEANKDDNTVCESGVCNDEGPLTAIEYLEDLTAGWDNVPTMTYTLENYADISGSGTYTYPSIIRENVKSRFLSMRDVENVMMFYLSQVEPSLSEENLRAFVIRNMAAINELATEEFEQETNLETVEDVFELAEMSYSHYNLFYLVIMLMNYGIESDYFDVEVMEEIDYEEILQQMSWGVENLDSDSATDVPKGYWLSDTDTTEENLVYYNCLSGPGISAQVNDTEIGVRPVIVVPKEKIDGSMEEEDNSNKILSEIATTSTELGITEVDDCATSGTCAPGTPFAIKVNNYNTYKFYVLKDYGNKVDLIMDRNLGSGVAFINEKDYKATVGDDFEDVRADIGPITALKYLELKTSGWSNIISMPYIVEYDGTLEHFNYKVVRNSAKARLITSTEAIDLGCKPIEENSCPAWLTDNLDSSDTIGYWSSTGALSSNATNINLYGYFVATVDDENNIKNIGVRPIISVPKSNLENYVEVTSVSLSEESVTIDVGNTKTVTATYAPSNTINNTLVWESYDDSIATVDQNGVITGVFEGTTTIEVRAKYSKYVKATMQVTVKNPYENGIMNSTDNCINTGTCTAGTRVNVKVNSSETYDFYVISDTGSELTLIMSQNIGEPVQWNSNGTITNGPLTALNYLESQTSGWTNITPYDYTLNNDRDYYEYVTIRTGVRARLLNETDIATFKTEDSELLPDWFYPIRNAMDDNYGYWLSTAIGDTNAFKIQKYATGPLVGGSKVDDTDIGVRPVIKVSK